MATNSGNHAGRWLLLLRPLFFWLLLVLALYGIREHQRMMEKTRLNFSVTLAGQQLEAVGLLDKVTFSSGQNISLAEHRFVIDNPKAELFVTNFFGWYGPHDLGEIKLKRSFGTLNVQANPPAPTIVVTGPEFSVTLHDCAGTNLLVPTDSYTVRAQYLHWSQTQSITAYDKQSVSCNFAPQWGALHLTCNKDDATYLLQSTDQTFRGNLPAMLTDQPVENYQLTVTYHLRHITKSLFIDSGITNEVPFQFTLGAVRIESSPAGASVATTNGNYLGQTPLLLSDVPVHTAQLNLSLSGYEPVTVFAQFTADQTNVCRTNLISTSYQSDLQQARTALASGDYGRAAQITTGLLNAMPNDGEAQALQSKATEHLAAAQQQALAENAAERERQEQLKRPREVFDAICQQNPDASMFAEHGFKTDIAAKAVATAIAQSLSSKPRSFELLYNDSPKPDVYEVMARQTFSLGILGGTERVCLLVVGQTKPDETQILFKVLEYQIKTIVNAGSLFGGKENKQMIPVSPDKIQMTDVLQAQLREGVQIVTGRIQSAVGPVQ